MEHTGMNRELFAFAFRFWVLIVCLEQRVSLAVEIRRLSIPRYVENGTTESVILDCDYTYNENDIRLVVKWFFDDYKEPVYQWIPELGMRHVSGVLLGKLDLDYSVKTVDAYTKYRALRIKNPTTELSGKYTCLVTSLAGQDSRSQMMTVFVPASTMDVKYQATSEHINVTCEATGLFPRPRLQLYRFLSHKRFPSIVPDTLASTTTSKYAYNASLFKDFDRNEPSVAKTTGFECVVEIPGTDYQRKKRLVYHPGMSQIQMKQEPTTAGNLGT